MFRFFVSQHVWHIQIAKEVLLYLKRPWYRWLVIHAYNPSDFHFSPDTKCDLEEKDFFFFFIPFLHEPTMREQVNVIGCQTTHTDFFLLLRRRVIILRLQFKSDLLHFFFFLSLKILFLMDVPRLYLLHSQRGGGGGSLCFSSCYFYIYEYPRTALGKVIWPTTTKIYKSADLSGSLLSSSNLWTQVLLPLSATHASKVSLFFLSSVYRREFRMSIVGNNSFCSLHFFSFFFPILVPFAEMARLWQDTYSGEEEATSQWMCNNSRRETQPAFNLSR